MSGACGGMRGHADLKGERRDEYVMLVVKSEHIRTL